MKGSDARPQAEESRCRRITPPTFVLPYWRVELRSPCWLVVVVGSWGQLFRELAAVIASVDRRKPRSNARLVRAERRCTTDTILVGRSITIAAIDLQENLPVTGFFGQMRSVENGSRQFWLGAGRKGPSKMRRTSTIIQGSALSVTASYTAFSPDDPRAVDFVSVLAVQPTSGTPTVDLNLIRFDQCRGRSRVLGRERTRPTRYSRPTTVMIGAMASVLTSARTGTYGRSTVVGLSRMDARPVTGPLHK